MREKERWVCTCCGAPNRMDARTCRLCGTGYEATLDAQIEAAQAAVSEAREELLRLMARKGAGCGA